MTNGLFDEKSCTLKPGEQKGEIQPEHNQTDKTAAAAGQLRLRTLVAHESRDVGVTLRMVNRPGKEKKNEKRSPQIRQADLWEHLAVPSILFIYLSSISKRQILLLTFDILQVLAALIARFLLSNSDVKVSCHLVDVNVPMYSASIRWLHRSILPTHTHIHTHRCGY